MIRLNDAQHRRVKKLTRCHCANNVRGCCLLLDDGEPCVCVQAISYSLLCRYFQIGRASCRERVFRAV